MARMKKDRITEIYIETMKCAEKMNASNSIKCLKCAIKNEIGDEKEMLLKYKINYTKLCDYAQPSFVISIFTLIVTLFSIVTSPNSVEAIVIIVIYLVVIGIYAVYTLKYCDRAKTILMVLESIEEEMNNK